MTQSVSEITPRILRDMRDGVLALDMRGRILFLNEQGRTLLGESQDLTGQRYTEAFLGREGAEANDAFAAEDPALAAQVEPLEETVDEMCDALRERHIVRLKEGGCSIEGGVVFLDVLTNTERISDHCANIAGRIVGMGRDEVFNARLAKARETYLAPLGIQPPEEA